MTLGGAYVAQDRDMLLAMAEPEDLVKTAGRFFSKLGTALKHTTKQVTGLGRGSVKLELDAARVAPGAMVRGRIALALDEAVDAKRLIVTVRARQKIVTITKTTSGKTVGTTHAEIYRFDLELGGAKRYESGSVAFELTIPPDALELRPSSGGHPLADAVRTIASALSPSAGPIEWQVIGRLDIAWGRDLTTTVDIVVAR